MAKVLVTGGAGFIGSHVADALVRHGHEVTVLDDLSGGCQAHVAPRASFVEGSVADSGLIDRLFAAERFEYVYHLAAYAAEGLSHFVKRFNYANNVIGSVNLINASVNTEVKGFVFASSIAVYGASPTLPFHEAVQPSPGDSYGIAKFAIEQELAACRDVFGLNYVVFRPHNVYGPRQNVADPYRNVVGIFMNQILNGQPMTIFGDGRQTRAFSYIDDVAPIMAETLEVSAAWNEVFNIGADRPYTVNELAQGVAGAMGVDPAIVHVPARHEARHVHSAHEKVRRVFGSRAETRLPEGLRAMAHWVRQHGPRARTSLPSIEVAKNLPEAWRRSGR